MVLDSIEVSIPRCHRGDPGSIPGRGAFLILIFFISKEIEYITFSDLNY